MHETDSRISELYIYDIYIYGSYEYSRDSVGSDAFSALQEAAGMETC